MTNQNGHSINFLLVGVGGQGTILASDVLAEVGIEFGCQVKKAEIHGMSQRGGSVISQVRWGSQVYSPIISRGTADILIAFEKLEACRYIKYLRYKGSVLVNDYAILPITVTCGQARYPTDEQIHNCLTSTTDHIYWMNGYEISTRIGNIRVTNMVLLGALSIILKHDVDNWLKVVENHVPRKYLTINLEAFLQGRQVISDMYKISIKR